MVGLKEENKYGVVSINGKMCPTVNREDWVRVPATPKNTGQHNGMHQVSKTSDGKSSILLPRAKRLKMKKEFDML